MRMGIVARDDIKTVLMDSSVVEDRERRLICLERLVQELQQEVTRQICRSIIAESHLQTHPDTKRFNWWFSARNSNRFKSMDDITKRWTPDQWRGWIDTQMDEV